MKETLGNDPRSKKGELLDILYDISERLHKGETSSTMISLILKGYIVINIRNVVP